MKRFLKRSAFFILFFTLFFILINFLFLGVIAVTDWDFKKRLESLNFNDPDFELLVLGSSLSQYGVDTELITSQGIKSFNLGLVGNNIRTCHIQLMEYLTQYKNKPKYLFLVINSYLEKLEGNKIQPIVEFTMSGHDYSVKDIPILKFGGIWFGGEVLKKIFSDEHRNAQVIYGQIKRFKKTPDNTCYKNLYLNLEKVRASDWIGKIAEECKLNDIELIIIEIPGVRETQNLSEIGPYTLNFNNGYSASLYNFNCPEFCNFIDPANDWVGDSHLNTGGAHKFTYELIKILK